MGLFDAPEQKDIPLPPPPVFAQQPVGKRPKQKSATPSYLGSELSAPTSGSPNFGGKTLLGQ